MKVKLSKLCEIYSGGDKPNLVVPNRTDECLYPIYGNALDNEGLYGYTNFFEINENAVTISARGSNCGATFFRDQPFVPIVRLLSLVPNRKIDARYLYYVVKNRNFHSTGSGQPQITIPQVADCEVDIFLDLLYQKRVANVLGKIDSKIKSNNRIIFELESMAKTLYDYWFLQFEFLNEEGKPYKSSGGKMVYNEELKREIPEGWKVENMMESSLCSDIKAGVEKFESKNYLPTANIEGESITDGEYVTFDNRENRANMQPVKYSVWFAKMKNSIKHLSIPENSGWFINKYILSTGFQGLKCTKTSFAYIHSIINSSWFETYKDILSHGATQEGVNNEDLKNIKYVVPSNNVLIEFNKICMPALEKKFSIIRENQELVSLRDFLLPMLMNGQVNFK